ncbi:MAG: hypothetical protein J6J60_06730 [Clostridia bacterium]|nr:hypothetical protein [Clostridia bacterium]
MENKENKKKGKIIPIAVAIIVVVCIAVAIFFVSSNNTENSANSNNNSNNENNNASEVSSISEEEIEKYVELNFREFYPNEEVYKIDKIEKYEDCGNGRYIYIVYHNTYNYRDGQYIYVYEPIIKFVDASNPEKVRISSVTCRIENLEDTIQEYKAESDEEKMWFTYSKSNSSNNTSTSSDSSSNDYLDDLALKALAFKKWLDKDAYVSAQYDYSNCTYTGNITKNSDGSVSVDLVLYDKDTYEQCLQYRVPVSNAKLASTTIKLTKEEATK